MYRMSLSIQKANEATQILYSLLTSTIGLTLSFCRQKFISCLIWTTSFFSSALEERDGMWLLMTTLTFFLPLNVIFKHYSCLSCLYPFQLVTPSWVLNIYDCVYSVIHPHVFVWKYSSNFNKHWWLLRHSEVLAAQPLDILWKKLGNLKSRQAYKEDCRSSLKS